MRAILSLAPTLYILAGLSNLSMASPDHRHADSNTNISGFEINLVSPAYTNDGKTSSGNEDLDSYNGVGLYNSTLIAGLKTPADAVGWVSIIYLTPIKSSPFFSAFYANIEHASFTKTGGSCWRTVLTHPETLCHLEWYTSPRVLTPRSTS